ncbi:hypothetical protein PM082_021160 [Marasmius tenuissimus]|nr:hypothetical protein PM082_021160 [Marasmius tenuissimus]
MRSNSKQRLGGVEGQSSICRWVISLGALPVNSDVKGAGESGESEVADSRKNPSRTSDIGVATASRGSSIQGASGSGTCVLCTNCVSSLRAFHAVAYGHPPCYFEQNLTLPNVYPLLDAKTRTTFHIKAQTSLPRKLNPRSLQLRPPVTLDRSLLSLCCCD